MKIIFFHVRQRSCVAAKHRLSAVINDDRLNVSQNKTMEKIRKEVAAVLKKYASDDSEQSITVRGSGRDCVLAAKISLKAAP